MFRRIVGIWIENMKNSFASYEHIINHIRREDKEGVGKTKGEEVIRKRDGGEILKFKQLQVK